MPRKNNAAFARQVQAGFEHMAKSRVEICGLARDCRQALVRITPKLERLGECFESYSINVVENDSKDGTAEFLSAWSSGNPNVRLNQFCTCPWITDLRDTYKGTNWWFSKARMERMNFARNLYLEALNDSDSLDYVIVIDLDILSFSLAGIAHTFGLKTPWDCVASNGTRYSVRHPLRMQIYWDTYVYEPAGGFPDDVLRKKDILARQKHLSKALNKQELFPVKSAFGGLCIYRREALGRHRYSTVNNSDPEVEVLCDHTSLHRSMVAGGKNKAFINPHQVVRYETLVNLVRRYFRGS